MRPVRSVRFTLAGISLMAALAPNSGVAEGHLGVPTCKSVSQFHVCLVVRSTADVRCALEYPRGRVERYKGESGIALGLDLSFNSNEKFASMVITSSNIKPGKHSLTGKYFDSRSAATASPGLGAAGLVGGYDDGFGLNPVALEATKGVGIATGLDDLPHRLLGRRETNHNVQRS